MHVGVCTCDMYIATCGVLDLHYKITFYFDLWCYSDASLHLRVLHPQSNSHSKYESNKLKLRVYVLLVKSFHLRAVSEFN